METNTDMRRRHVAVVQAGSCLFDTPATLDRMERLCREARQTGAGFVVFPEAFIGGYPKGSDFGARVGLRTPAGREDYLRYWRSAIEIPGPETARIGELASATRATLVTGAIEREGGTLYCTALTFGPDGALLAKHRKLMPTAMERLVWGQGDGSTLRVIDTPAGRAGAAICWENHMPMLRATLYSQNIELWCAPTVDDREIWAVSMRHIAWEGRCFVLSAVQYLTREDCPPGYEGARQFAAGAPLIRGGSVIVSPLGELLAGPVYGRECVLAAEIDLDDVVRGRYDLDVTGHYSRPDVFQLRVDRGKKMAVAAPGDSAIETQEPELEPQMNADSHG